MVDGSRIVSGRDQYSVPEFLTGESSLSFPHSPSFSLSLLSCQRFVLAGGGWFLLRIATTSSHNCTHGRHPSLFSTRVARCNILLVPLQYHFMALSIPCSLLKWLNRPSFCPVVYFPRPPPFIKQQNFQLFPHHTFFSFNQPLLIMEKENTQKKQGGKKQPRRQKQQQQEVFIINTLSTCSHLFLPTTPPPFLNPFARAHKPSMVLSSCANGSLN